MSNLTLNNVIVHELIKEVKKPFDFSNLYNLRKKTLDKENETVCKLIYEITSMYGQKGNSAHYGVFKSELTEQGPIPGLFEAYSTAVPVDDSMFIDFSIKVMKQLVEKAKDELWSSGGYIVFADYSRDNDRFFLITMIKQKKGISISKKLEPEELMQLDLNKINQAARVSFNRYAQYKVSDEVAKTDLSYLSFISKGANQSASGYFITAIGCDKGIASSKATTRLPTEIKRFFLKHPELKDKAVKFRRDIINYLDTQFSKDESARLSDIETLTLSQLTYIDPEKREDLVNQLMAHLNSEAVRIPTEFVVSRSSLNKLKSLVYKGDSFGFNFENSSLGETADADVWFDKASGMLTFTNIPDDTKKKINETLEELAKIRNGDNIEND
ncbi:nucleoid-associated protein [Yersinia enterocolitica]|uniref:nucleoid-associated protein n=1 Tax=Yersinia enterocolitica TaxID=630 RepID=UPI003CFF3B95